MPDILLVSANSATLKAVQAAAGASGVRLKSCVDTAQARDWLKLRAFDGLLLENTVSWEDKQTLGGELWHRNSSARLYILYPRRPGKVTDATLLGAEDIEIATVDKSLAILANQVNARRPRQDEKFTVLLVEDLDAPRDIIGFYLEGLGFPGSVGVASAKAAVELLEADPSRFQCVITDIRMPEMTGLELLEFIRSHPRLKHLPVIVLTAYGTTEHLIECLTAGATGFLVKPPKKFDLLREMARAVRTHLGEASPRLAGPEETEALRTVLIQRGY